MYLIRYIGKLRKLWAIHLNIYFVVQEKGSLMKTLCHYEFSSFPILKI